MENGSPIPNLDNHHCPKCNWCFINRIPRTLDCTHSFYFCEECLKSKTEVQCTICRRMTIIKQILSPRNISNKSLNTSSHEWSFCSPNSEVDNTAISQYATLLTQFNSTTTRNRSNNNPTHKVQLLTSPLKHYKHYNKFSSSQPLKHSNNRKKIEFEYDQIINLQKEIVSIKNELESDNNNNQNENKNEINFMKQQIVELLIDKEKLTKKCDNMSEEIAKLKDENAMLIQQTTQQKQELRKYMLSKQCLNKLQLQCFNLSTEMSNYKTNLLQNSLKPFMKFINNEMNKMLKMSKHILYEYNKEVLLRRKYFNEIQDLKGNIRVFCRIRPLLDNELSSNLRKSVHSINNFKVNIEKNKSDPSKDYKKTFEFDRVYSTRSTQDEVFNETKDLITSILDGYNVCIFAYGQTGSGKTYTMEGINYRTITQLFNVIKQRELNYKYTMKLNMVEIYNENIKDLLAISNDKKSEIKDLKRKSIPTYLKIRGNGKTGIKLNNLSELNCNCINDVYNALDIGYKNRSCGITDMNEHSSRSHCILTVNVEGIHFNSNRKYLSKLNLIDLAGSERVKVSNASGNTMKEAQCINKSLSCLGNVLESIKSKKQYIPYRDSKLTHLLKDSLGNSAKTLMFVNVSSCSKDIDQTLSSLVFANRVRNVCLGKTIRNQSKISEQKKKPYIN